MLKKLIFSLTGFVLFSLVWWWRLQAEGRFNFKNNQKITIVGQVSSSPRIQNHSQRFFIGQIEVFAPQYPSYVYGEKLRVSGTLKTRVINPNFKQFRLIYPKISKVVSQPSSSKKIQAFLYRFRAQVESIYNQVLPEPEASLLSGIVLGSKRELPEEFYQALQQTSTLHIVVASGYNLTVVTSIVLGFLSGPLKRQWAVLASLVFAWGYVALVGFEPAVLRAGIMISALMMGQLLNRQTSSLRALFLAGGVMLLSQPQILWNLGFQLSFLATLGLVLLSPMFSKLDQIKFLNFGPSLKETLSAQIMVLPLLVYHFQSFSPIGFLINPLVLFLTAPLTFIGIFQALFFAVFKPFSKLFSWFTYGLLHTMVVVIKLGQVFSKNIFIAQLPLGFFVIYYGIVFYLTFRYYQKTSVSKKIIQKQP